MELEYEVLIFQLKLEREVIQTNEFRKNLMRQLKWVESLRCDLVENYFANGRFCNSNGTIVRECNFAQSYPELIPTEELH